MDIVVPEGTSGAASYAAPAKDGSRNGTFYINLNDLNVFQKTVATTLALHEALPGHHFQVYICHKSSFQQQHVARNA